MAISSSTNRSHFNGNGSTTAFATGFPFFAAADLLVIVKSSAGVESEKTLTTHYTVSGGNGSTGTVTMLTAPASGETLTIINNKAALQEVEFSDNDQIPADSIEEGMDRLARVVARSRDLGDRAVRLPDSTVLSTFDPKLPTTLTADAVLAINDAGNGFKMGPTTAAIEQFKDDAETAATASQAAQAAAEDARDAAQTAETNAETAETNAETAETNAEAARDLALQYRNEAEGFKDDAEAAAGSVLTSIGPVGSSPNANGGTISSNTLTLQPADGVYPGLMLAGSQTLGGAKTWNGGQNLASYLEFDSVGAPSETGDNITLSLPSKVVNVLADNTLNSVAGVTGASNARIAVYVNGSGEDIVFRNESGSASAINRITTGTGSDLTVKDGGAVILVYDTALTRWRVAGGAGGGSSTVFGSTGSPRSIVAGTGITSGAAHMSTSATEQIVFVEGDTGGEEDISANPQIEAHTIVGAKMRLYGANDTDFVKLETGNGLLLNGVWYSYSGAILDLMWNGTVWAEAGRNN